MQSLFCIACSAVNGLVVLAAYTLGGQDMHILFKCCHLKFFGD